MVPIVESFYRIPNAPRLALLADLHGRPFDRVEASLRERRPALICVAGDIRRGLSPLEAQGDAPSFLRACAGLAPTYLSLGNHDICLDAEDLEAIRATGATLLDNRWIEQDGLVIGGLTSASATACRACPGSLRRRPRAGDPKPRPDVAWLPAFAAVPGFHILLCHHPEYFPRVPGSVELVLSGHAHGGQWRFYNPVRRQWAGLYAPGQGLFPRWTKGVYEGRLVVSAGLANTLSLPRLFNPTEIVYVSGTGEWPSKQSWRVSVQS